MKDLAIVAAACFLASVGQWAVASVVILIYFLA